MAIDDFLHHEGLSLAPVKKRITALVIDDLILSLLLIIMIWDQLSTVETVEDAIMMTNSFMLEFMIIKIIYQTLFIYQYGATLGKMMMKIEVIAIEGLHAMTLPIALNRAIVRIVSELPFYLGFLWGVFDPYRQTWHDKTAKTLVVNVQ